MEIKVINIVMLITSEYIVFIGSLSIVNTVNNLEWVDNKSL